MIAKIKKKLISKDAKVLLENFISLSALQLVSMVLPLITLPYILRVIGFEKYGVIMFSAALIAYFTSLTDFSFKYTATRDVAVFKNSQRKLNIIYSKVLSIKLIFLLISFLFIGIIVYAYPPFYQNRLIYFLTMPMLLGNVLFPEWFFQGIEKMKYITILNVGIKVFFTLGIFLFIKNEGDFWVYPLLNSAGFVVAGIIGQVILVRKYKLQFLILKKKTLWSTIENNSPIFINQFLPTLYNNTSTFLLGLLTNNTMVGIYEAIKVVINLCIKLIETLSRVFFPFLNRKKNAFSAYAKLMYFVAIVMFIGCLVLYKFVFWYLTITHESAFLILAILTFGVVGYAMYDIYGINYYIIRRQDKLVMNNTLIASIAGFILAFPLIYYWGIIGAAVNLSLARWLMGGGLWYKYIKEEL